MTRVAVAPGAGRVAAIRITQGAGVSENYDYNTGLTTPPASIPAASAAGGVTRSLFGYDLSGRQTSQTDYDAGGSSVVYSHSAVYAMNGQLTSDFTSTLKYEQNGYSTATYATASSYSYSSTGGEYLLGAVGSVTTTNTKNNVYQNGSSTTNSYLWYDSAVQGTIDYKPNTGQSTVFTTSFLYDAQGTLTKAHIADGRVRDVTYRSNADGQIIRRDEADTNYNATTGGDPHELWYRFAGKEFGYVGNNGTSKVTEDASIADRRAYQNTGAFRNGSSSYASASDFAQSSAPINSYSQGTAAGGYTVQRSGETLRSVAQSVWGDASLWYKLADANGMKGDMALAEGQHLTLPAGVSRTRNNAATLTPYNPNDAIGNVSPSTPQPAARNNHCGIFGAILRLVIAAVVSLFNPFAAIPIIGPVTTDAIAQGIDIAVGLQDKFDFAQSGITAIAATVDFGISQAANALAQTSGALRQVGQFVKAGTPLARAAVGALSNAITQGVAVATGLQSKFDFAGVAAAGVAAGVSRSLSTHFAAGGFSLGERLLTSTASGLANAATRSVIAGTDFGDNIIAALPAAIVNTFSDYVTERITGEHHAHGTDNSKAGGRGTALNSATPGTAQSGDGQNLYIDEETGEKRLYIADPGDTVYDLRTADGHRFGPALLTTTPGLWELGSDGFVHPSTQSETANANLEELAREQPDIIVTADPAKLAAARAANAATMAWLQTFSWPTASLSQNTFKRDLLTEDPYASAIFSSIHAFSPVNYSGPDRRWDLPDNTPQWKAYTAEDRALAYERERSAAFLNAGEGGAFGASLAYNYGLDPSQIRAAGQLQGIFTDLGSAAYVTGASRRSYLPPNGVITISLSFRGSAAKGTPYSNLVDSPSVGPGKSFTAAQKAKIYQQNIESSGGVLRSDLNGEILVPPSKSVRGVTPPANEAQIDHILARVPGDPRAPPGSNSFGNAQVLSRAQNRAKSNR